MRVSFVIILMALAFCSCSDNTKQEKDQLNAILKVHDKVMDNDDVLMKNKMKLDSMLKVKTIKDTTEIKALDVKLAAAEDSMEDWMHKFEPDPTGKSHDEIMQYYTEQKKQITAVDSVMNQAISEANQYFSNHK